ncbi:hypothetical protein H0H92_002947 [Tricholoma furcatifolium]|nr:hypothetical protein H0H92_002947 [Tricholoma furcatifolium]
MIKKKLGFLLLCLSTPTVFGQPKFLVVAPKKFLSIPLGNVRPAGWLMDQLQIQTNGMAGNLHNFYDYVADTDWMGGTSFYSNLEEAGSYWYPFFLGAIQMVEANSTLTDSVVTALYKFVSLANTMIQAGEGLEEWTEARWEDFAITLQWLYDNHPNGQEELLIDTMILLKSTGYPWEQVFSEEYFPTDLDTASSGWDLVFQYHGRPSGIFAADEYLAGLEAVRGTELCLVVETMFSGSYLYQVIGDPKFADRVERITYNALPATLTGSQSSIVLLVAVYSWNVAMWSRQYLQQQNQIAAKNMNPDPLPTDGSYSNVFGLEPNYPCCTVNHPQGWPKFISNAFLTTPYNLSLVHLYLGPFSTSVTLGSDNQVTATVDTLYPFSDTLKTTITATSDFTYFVRIPSWVTDGSITINDDEPSQLSPVNGLQAVPVQAGTTTFVLDLPAPITTVSRNQTILAQNAEQPLAVDLEFDATTAWQYAIDPNTLQFNNAPPASGVLPSPVFDSGMSPLSITVTACSISWDTAGDTFAASPPESPACTGAQQTLTLTPYGITKLRIGEFPVFSSS